jgi:hypothetical protein
LRLLRPAASQVIGLFVSDWRQTGVVLAVLAVGWFVVGRTHSLAAGVAVVLLLGAQLVYFASAAAARRGR